MKMRGVDSPDDADALALTFAMTVAPRPVQVEDREPNYGTFGGVSPWR